MLDRVFDLLDSRHLSRLGNLRTLIAVGVAGALVFIGLVLAAVQLLTKAGWVPLLFLGVGLAVAFAAAFASAISWWQERKRRRDVGPAEIELGDRLTTAADQIEGLFHAREVEEPRRVQPPGVVLPLQFEGQDEHYDALATYRKKTMALYYERHRAEALAAFDACSRLTAGRERERSIIQKPLGTAALALVPGILRDMANRVTGAY